MTAPAYKCPFKDATCATVSCGLYNSDLEDCNFCINERRKVKLGISNAYLKNVGNMYSSSSSSSSSSSRSSSSSSTSA